MPTRKVPLITDQYYHIFNRGVARQPMFKEVRDYKRFIKTMQYYQHVKPKLRFSDYLNSKDKNLPNLEKTVEIIAYCLMPNHFHFLLRQKVGKGISDFVRISANSYDRVGPLMQGKFKAILVETDEQLLHLSRYIHLNPTSSFVTNDLEKYYWSSYLEYTSEAALPICEKETILSFFSSQEAYRQFVLDQENYARKLTEIEHLLSE